MRNTTLHPLAPRTLRRFAFAACVGIASILHAAAQMPSRTADPMPPETKAPSPAAAPAPPILGIAHVALRVKNVAASVAFYHMLGFDQALSTASGGQTSEPAFLKINDRQFLELDPLAAHDAAPGQSAPGFLHLCFEAADLNALHDAYVAQGLAPVAVRTAANGDLLLEIRGPAQPAGPQEIEFTQYMPGSGLSKDTGQHLGPDRVGNKLTVVALAMQDPAAARAFYVDKLGFRPSATSPARLDLPGSSGESIEIVPAADLGSRSSIVLQSADLDKAAAQLTRQQVPFQRAASTASSAGATHTLDMISVTDPDGNILRIAQTR